MKRLSTLVLALFVSDLAFAADPTPALDGLLKEYKYLGLPLPPDDAKLVREATGLGRTADGQLRSQCYRLLFLLKPATKTEPASVMSGTVSWAAGNRKFTDVKPDVTAAVDLEPSNQNEKLYFAIQCHAQGWVELAARLLELDRTADARQSPQKLLLAEAWLYWEYQATHPSSDRTAVAKRLKDLVKRDPRQDTSAHRDMIKALDLALVPSTAKAGSVEALIDGLVDYHRDGGPPFYYVPDDLCWKLAERGFDAVPALIEHLGDRRLTRTRVMGFNNDEGGQMWVGAIVGNILEQLAGEDWEWEPLGDEAGKRKRIAKSIATAWWEKVQKVGEEAYCMSRVLPADPDDETQTEHPNEHLLCVLAAKYPKRLPALYRTVLDERKRVYSAEFAEALGRCKLPAKDKLDLFVAAARHKNFEHRQFALREMKALDQKQFDAHLLATIEALPRDVKGHYWSCPEALIAAMAVGSADPRVWPAVEEAVKRASLGLRMEILHAITQSREQRWRPERLRLLASYLDDAELRDNSTDKRLDGPGAGFEHKRIEVRDFVALELAHLLDIETAWGANRTSAEWAKLRDQVKDEVKKELTKK